MNPKYCKYCLLLCCGLALSHAYAQISGNVIPFQGQLANQAGQPLSPTNAVTLVFRLYQVPVGGTAIWEESQPNISVNAGRFSVLLGSRTQLPASTYFNATLYLGIKVDDGNPVTADVEMRPRQALVPVISARYAQNASQLNGYDWSVLFGTNNPASGTLSGSRITSNSITAGQIGNNTITSNQLASNSVTANQLAPGAVTGAAVANGAIGSRQLAQGGVQNPNLGIGIVTLTNLAPRMVGTNVPVGWIAMSASITTNFANPGYSGTLVPGLTVTLCQDTNMGWRFSF
jgi:hypothetical protein